MGSPSLLLRLGGQPCYWTANALAEGTASQKTDCSQTIHEDLIAKAELYENEGNQILTFQIIEPGNTMVTLHHANKKTRFG